MKKLTALFLVLAALLALAACSSSPERSNTVSQFPTVNDILESGAQAAEKAYETQNAPASEGESVIRQLSPPEQEVEEDFISEPDPNYDIDLTAMNANMVYSQVYDMVMSPENYVGKTVKMEGLVSTYHGETRDYYACIIADATACCAQGMEFMLKDSYAKEEYPKDGDTVTVGGVFDTYYEDDYLYCQLADAVME